MSFAPVAPEDKLPDQRPSCCQSTSVTPPQDTCSRGEGAGASPQQQTPPVPDKRHPSALHPLPSSLPPFSLIRSSISHPHAGRNAWKKILKYLWVLFQGSVSMATALKERRTQIDFHPEWNQSSWNMEVPGRSGGGHRGQ